MEKHIKSICHQIHKKISRAMDANRKIIKNLNIKNQNDNSELKMARS